MVRYREVPEEPIKFGEAKQHYGTTKSALEIASWLSEAGIQAWVLPKGLNFPSSIVRVDNTLGGPAYVVPTDWVLLDESQEYETPIPVIINNYRFETYYKKENN